MQKTCTNCFESNKRNMTYRYAEIGKQKCYNITATYKTEDSDKILIY